LPGSCSVPSAAPSWAPSWVFCPEERILSVVVEWLIAGVVSVGNSLSGAVAAVFDSFGLAGSTAGGAVVGAFSYVAGALFGVAFTVNNAILGLASSAGPVAPVVVVGLYLGVAVVLLASIVAIRKGILWLT